jgi:sugar phosphate isomerase/epimerase
MGQQLVYSTFVGLDETQHDKVSRGMGDTFEFQDRLGQTYLVTHCNASGEIDLPWDLVRSIKPVYFVCCFPMAAWKVMPVDVAETTEMFGLWSEETITALVQDGIWIGPESELGQYVQ